jgi:hypothetical protein
VEFESHLAAAAGRRPLPTRQASPRTGLTLPWSWCHRCQAEHAAESLSKGSRVVVIGRLQQRSWTAEDGSARSTVEVVADELGPSLQWAIATPSRATRTPPPRGSASS